VALAHVKVLYKEVESKSKKIPLHHTEQGTVTTIGV